MGAVSGLFAQAFGIALMLLTVLTPRPAPAQSVLQCQLVNQSSDLHGMNYAADVSDGYLRLLLIHRSESDGASSVFDFDPFSDHRSIYASKGDGDNADPEFWMATIEADGQILIDRWTIFPSGAAHTYIRLQCPSHKP